MQDKGKGEKGGNVRKNRKDGMRSEKETEGGQRRKDGREERQGKKGDKGRKHRDKETAVANKEGMNVQVTRKRNRRIGKKQ